MERNITDIFEEFRNVFDCEKTNDPIEQTAQSLLDIQVLKRYSSLKTSI
jgi:hypothetical protein